ncbi:MAG: pitrilysin family protein [Flavobacteriales bacterium]
MNRSTAHIVRRTHKVLCAFGGLLAPALMIAQLDRSHPPAPGPAPEVHLGDHASFTLPNGMRVIVVENHKLPMVNVQVRFDIPPVMQGDKTGYIDMVGDLLASGTTSRNKATIDEEVDRLGASLFASSDGVYASGLKKNLPAILDVVADVVLRPTFPQAEFDKQKTRLRSAIKQREDDPDAIAESVGRVVTFGHAHPYGEVMTEKTLSQVELKNVQGYYNRFFRPEKGYLVFVGDITEKEAKTLSIKHFGEWVSAVPVSAVGEDGSETVPGLGPVHYMPHVVTPSGERRVVLVDRPGAAQSVIRVVFPLNLQPKDLRALSGQLMNTILGGGVFNARLMQNLREDKGWTYGAHSSLDADRYNGGFTASVSVRTAVTDSAIREIFNELDGMRNNAVTAEEIDLAKNFMAGSFARSLEDPRTVARFALNTYLNDLPADHYATYLKRLDALTAADVQAAAESFLYPDNAVILVVGDRKSIYYKLKPLSMDEDQTVIELDENGDPYAEDLTPVSDRTVDQVIEAYLTALGGRAAIAKITDLRMEMGTTVNGKAETITKWFGPHGKFRSETKIGNFTMEEVVLDGSRASRKNQLTEKEELQDIDLLDLRMNARPVPETDLAEHVERMYLTGRTTVDGKPAYKVTMMTNAGTTILDYYDVQTGLKLRRVDQKFMYGKSLNIVTDYADYKAVNGVLFPHTIVEGGGPAGGEITINVNAIVANKGIAPALFDTKLPPVKSEE